MLTGEVLWVVLLCLGFSTSAAAGVTTYCCDASAERAYRQTLERLSLSIVSDDLEQGAWKQTRDKALEARVTHQGLSWYRSGGFIRTIDNGDSHDDRVSNHLMFADDGSLLNHPVPDGFSISANDRLLRGLGGWFIGDVGAKLAFSLDGDSRRVAFTGREATLGRGWKFLGFIDDREGFKQMDVRAIDERIEARRFFADDFTFGVYASTSHP